jgi:hypothetical protein
VENNKKGFRAPKKHFGENVWCVMEATGSEKSFVFMQFYGL